MAALIVEEKLESLRRCIARVEAKRADSAAELATDVDRQDIISLILTRAVQLSVDLALDALSSTGAAAPHTMGGAFDALAEREVIPAPLRDRLKAAVGFRNIAVHSYQAIDWAIVHTITHERLEDFRLFASAIASFDQAQGDA